MPYLRSSTSWLADSALADDVSKHFRHGPHRGESVRGLQNLVHHPEAPDANLNDGSSLMSCPFGGAFGRRETDDDSFMIKFAQDLESDYIEEAPPPGPPGSLHADAAAAY